MSFNPWENQLDAGYLLDKYEGQGGLGRSMNIVGADDYYFDLLCEKDFLRAYKECPPLKAMIGKRASAFNTGIIDVYRSGTKSNNKATGTEANSIRNVLYNPNILQTQKQFFAQQNHYIDIFGYCPVLKVRPSGIVDELSSIWNLPPWLFDIKYTGNWLRQNEIGQIYKGYWLFWGGERIELNMEDIFFIFDDGIGSEHDTNLTIPDSRLVGLEYPICNTIAAYKTRNTLITKRGAIGILSSPSKDVGGVIPMDADEKNALQKSFANYGLVGQPFQIIITDAALQWQQMGFPTAELMLFEEIDDNINRMCDAFGWPVELMSRSKDVTFDNKKQAIKSAYRDTVIPQSASRMEQLTKGLTLKETKNLIIYQDYSSVEVLQEDAKMLADARAALNNALQIEYKNGILTKNQWLDKLGEPQVLDNPDFDLYYQTPAPIIATPIVPPSNDPTNVPA